VSLYSAWHTAENGIVKVVIHAPSAGALARARADARDLLRARIEGIVRVVVSHDAVIAALDEPDPDVDPLMVLCADSLARTGRAAPGGYETTSNATLLLAQLARKGWTCVRA